MVYKEIMPMHIEKLVIHWNAAVEMDQMYLTLVNEQGEYCGRELLIEETVCSNCCKLGHTRRECLAGGGKRASSAPGDNSTTCTAVLLDCGLPSFTVVNISIQSGAMHNRPRQPSGSQPTRWKK